MDPIKDNINIFFPSKKKIKNGKNLHTFHVKKIEG